MRKTSGDPMSFGVLSLIALAGLAGPLLGGSGRLLVPAVVGELLAGLLLGRSGFAWLNPDQPTTAFLSEIGFAMVMLAAGMHVPLRHTALLTRARRGALAAITTGILAIAAGQLAARITHVSHPSLYAVVLASGSAAVLVPCLEEFGLLANGDALVVAAQVAIADIASIIAVPLVLRPGRAADAALGILLVTLAALAVFLGLHQLRGREWVRRLRRRSKQREWALDLRLSLLVLFVLCWITVRTGASILIAGFAVGLIVAATGGPKRLSRQVTGVAQGFFIPLFFVVLGAKIDVGALVHQRSLIELTLLLVFLNGAIHAAAALATRQSLAAGLAATAQLGVPAAVVSLGLQEGVISPGTGAALMAAGLASIAISTCGVALLARQTRTHEPSSNAANSGHQGVSRPADVLQSR
jgi:Kef-type K+ transport system membrane component KefB